MIRRLLIPAVAAALVLGCASGDPSNNPAAADRTISRGKYSGNETGPTPVGAIPDVPLRDPSRANRDILLTIEYPTRGGPHPLVVFSHEYGGSNRSYIGLSSYWSSNGYVVIRPAHIDRGGLEAQTETSWKERVRDVVAILDGLDVLEQSYPELKGKMDRTKIAVAGHGYGGQTALLAASDPRVKAVAVMVPDTRGVNLAELKIPALFITGARDPAQADKDPFNLVPAGDKWLVGMEGARGPAFTGRMESITEAQAREAARNDPVQDEALGQQQAQARAMRLQSAAMRMQEMFGIARGSALAFLDAYLKEEAAGREALEKIRERRGVVVERK